MSDEFQLRPFDAAVQTTVVDSMFGRPLVTNVFRSLLVEAMIAKALGPPWRWCAADFAPWDLEHENGLKLEVKQSAARQSWTQPDATPGSPRFDIAHRTGRWENSHWIEGRVRHADIYVFAHHPIIGPEADHRKSQQWRFYPVRTSRLPSAASIGLTRLETISTAVAADPAGRSSGRIGHLKIYVIVPAASLPIRGRARGLGDPENGES